MVVLAGNSRDPYPTIGRPRLGAEISIEMDRAGSEADWLGTDYAITAAPVPRQRYGMQRVTVPGIEIVGPGVHTADLNAPVGENVFAVTLVAVRSSNGATVAETVMDDATLRVAVA